MIRQTYHKEIPRKRHANELNKLKPYVERVLEKFCKANGQTENQIKGERKFRELVAVRQSFCKWATENTSLTLSKIGSLINNDHATVLYGAKTANNRLEVNDLLLTSTYQNCIASL